MSKSIILSIEELKYNLINTINQANVSPYFLEPVLRDLYLEVKDASRQQIDNEFKEYTESQKQYQDVSAGNANDETVPIKDTTVVVEEDKNDEDPK